LLLGVEEELVVTVFVVLLDVELDFPLDLGTLEAFDEWDFVFLVLVVLDLPLVEVTLASTSGKDEELD